MCVCGGGGGRGGGAEVRLSLFSRNLTIILMQLQSTNMFGPHLYHNETHIITNTAVKQSKWAQRRSETRRPIFFKKKKKKNINKNIYYYLN